MTTSAAAALGASVAGSGVAGASETEIQESDTEGAPSVRGDLKRFSNTAFGAEVTGPFVFEDGTLLYSLQHPDTDNPAPFDRAGIGYVSGFDFELDGTNDDFEELTIPTTEAEQRQVRVAEGDYVLLAQQEEPINGGTEQLGVPETPDGVSIEKFAGSRYAAAGYTPDCNQFIPSNEQGTEGHLFTNYEASPGNVSRIPVSRTEDGEWEADLENAINLANTESLRDLGGTRINCYGNRTPWNTMVSSEENYAHPRVSLTNTVSDIVENGGEGLVGAAQFWNRPNPGDIVGDIGSYAGQELGESWYPQGAFALAGVELLAYYLGADAADIPQEIATDTEDVYDGDEAVGENTDEPLEESYPNPYRYGYHLEFRDPHADEPTPVKHYVMGRASWEAPDFQNDFKTVYGCSDGDSKGIYKFVADRPMMSYQDPMNIEGTLYAPEITNTGETTADPPASPANTDLEVEWTPLGRASNAECEAWISEYDDVTQVDYLETHAETDWEDDLDAALREADLEVIANGNRNYITDEEIVEWAEQYEQNGPNGVDEDLRKVPFLETRAAAKEIGASIEFNKAEGVDSIEGARPGDYVYFGISEFNDDLADETGDVQMDRVDGGVVYRAQLEPDYNVSTFEPVIVGPDFTDGPEAANDALRNVDNVYVMDDGRVLCCEDGFAESQRSYPNDCLYVYEPYPMLVVESVEVDVGATDESEVALRHAPERLLDVPGESGEVTVSVADTAVAELTGASYGDAVSASDAPSVSADGSTVTFSAGDVDAVQLEGRGVDLATVSVTGTGEGETTLDATTTLGDIAPQDIVVETRSGAVTTDEDDGDDNSDDDGGPDNPGRPDNPGNSDN